MIASKINKQPEDIVLTHNGTRIYSSALRPSALGLNTMDTLRALPSAISRSTAVADESFTQWVTKDQYGKDSKLKNEPDKLVKSPHSTDHLFPKTTHLPKHPPHELVPHLEI